MERNELRPERANFAARGTLPVGSTPCPECAFGLLSLAIAIPFLSDIPILGPVLFDQSIIVYLMYVTVAVVQVALFRTRWGLRVRAVGEHPTAADTVGIKVNRTRVKNVLLGGLVAGTGMPQWTSDYFHDDRFAPSIDCGGSVAQ